MVRRGRSVNPPPTTRRAPPARAPSANVPARGSRAAPPPSSTHATPSGVGAQSTFKQMAATAGGVAVGSAVGHAIGSGISGMCNSSGKNADAPAQPEQNDGQEPCSREMKQFLQCAQGYSELTVCEGLNEALRQCKLQHHLQ